MKGKLSIIGFVVIFYLFLFQPSILIFTGILGVYNFILLFSLLLWMSNPRVSRRYVKEYKTEYNIILYLLIFSVLRSGIEREHTMITEHVMAMISFFVTVPYLIHYASKSNLKNNYGLIKLLLITASVASVISLACLLSPDVKNFFQINIMRFTQDQIFGEMNEYRLFGFAAKLSSDYGFIMGVITVIGIFYVKENRWFMFFVPLTILAALINARTGVVVALTGIILFLVSNNKIGYSLVVLVFAVLIYSNLEKLALSLMFNDRMIEWITISYEQTKDVILTGDTEYSNTINRLTGANWAWPEDIGQWLFGRGFDIYMNTRGVRASDGGWIRELNYGGLFYFVPLMYLIWTMFKRMYVKHNKAFALFFLATIIILNTKTKVFPGTQSFYIFVLIYFAYPFRVMNNVYSSKSSNRT